MLAKAGRGSIMLGAAVARARGAAASTLITMPQRDAAAEGRISSALPSAMRCQVRTLSASTASVSDGSGGREGEEPIVRRHVHMPPRTVPDELLTISIRTYFGADTADRYPNVHGVHPAEFKVELRVYVPDLGLTEKQTERLLLLVGPRYHAKRKVLKLVCDTYPNRIDNKRYLVYLLETLLAEARRAEE